MNVGQNVDDDDDYNIPIFLRVDRAEAARRAEYNAAHPVIRLDFSGQSAEKRQEADETRARYKAEQKERERQHLQAHRDRKRIDKPMPGMIWNGLTGKWVSQDFMSHARYTRLLSEMPTEEHRALFIKLYGSGHAAGKTPEAIKIKVKPTDITSGKSRSAGRLDVPASDWKTGVISMLSRPEGATLDEIGAAFGWQNHSASARLSAIRKERTVTATVEARGRVYRVILT